MSTHRFSNQGFGAFLERAIFGARMPLLVVFATITVVMAFYASQLRVDAGFKK